MRSFSLSRRCRRVSRVFPYPTGQARFVPCFSSSSLRFVPGIQELLKNEQLGTIVGAVTWGSCSYQEGTPDMFFYGIHGIEPLYALMGTGCETVTRIQSKDTDLVSGIWKDGRVGTYRRIRRNKADFGAIAFGSKGIVQAGRGEGYEELCREIGQFFKTRQSPISAEETIEFSPSWKPRTKASVRTARRCHSPLCWRRRKRKQRPNWENNLQHARLDLFGFTNAAHEMVEAANY